MLSCPRCNALNPKPGFPAWVILVAIFFFPIGLFALLTGRKPAVCHNCGFHWQT